METNPSSSSHIEPGVFKGHQLVQVGKNGAHWRSTKFVEVVFTYAQA